MKYTNELVDKLCDYIREGDTQRLACRKVGISDSIFHEWKNTKEEFSEAIKKAHDDFNDNITGKLEATLWKRAMGYEVTETDTEYVNDANGRPVIKQQKTRKKHIIPDTGALIFALTNVAGEKWKNKINSSVDANVKSEVTGDVKTRYALESLPDDMLFALADKLQENEANNGKNGEKEGDSEGKA